MIFIISAHTSKNPLPSFLGSLAAVSCLLGLGIIVSENSKKIFKLNEEVNVHTITTPNSSTEILKESQLESEKKISDNNSSDNNSIEKTVYSVDINNPDMNKSDLNNNTNITLSISQNLLQNNLSENLGQNKNAELFNTKIELSSTIQNDPDLIMEPKNLADPQEQESIDINSIINTNPQPDTLIHTLQKNGKKSENEPTLENKPIFSQTSVNNTDLEKQSRIAIVPASESQKNEELEAESINSQTAVNNIEVKKEENIELKKEELQKKPVKHWYTKKPLLIIGGISSLIGMSLLVYKSANLWNLTHLKELDSQIEVVLEQQEIQIDRQDLQIVSEPHVVQIKEQTSQSPLVFRQQIVQIEEQTPQVPVVSEQKIVQIVEEDRENKEKILKKDLTFNETTQEKKKG